MDRHTMLGRGLVATLVLSLSLSQTASADEIKVWTARAIATVLAEEGTRFERATGHRLAIVSDLPAGFLSRAKAGESFDVLISTSSTLDEWIERQEVLRGSRREIASSEIGVAVRAGASKPSLSSVEEFKRALLQAKSIAWLRVGSGLHMDRVIEKLQIAAEVEPKVTRPRTDIVCELVRQGEVELGIVVITQILTTPGVELVASLPPELQLRITFEGGIAATSKSPNAAKQLIDFLRAPETSEVIKAQGMAPAE
jgi:molybdate transport system substrate-binding protein